MKDIILRILDDYKLYYRLEQERQERLDNFLKNSSSKEIIDWNNFNGHVVASGFVYAKKEEKFLVMYHKDMQIYTYPGGHMTSEDDSPYLAALREVQEETGLSNLESITINNDKLIPFDIDTHLISYNKRLDLPEHYHFDFRYLFTIEEITDIKVDEEELSEYKWISHDELASNPDFGYIIDKIDNLICNSNN